MATLTYDQIVQVARSAGLPGDPEVWAAIAMAESSGRTDVVNEIGCVGLWQINQPVHVKSHPSWTVAWLQNPVNNAKAAKVIYHQQGFAAWQAYTGPDGTGSDGPWRQYYQQSSSHKAESASWWNDYWKSLKDLPGLLGPEDIPGLGGGGDLLGGATGLGDVATGIGTIAEAVQKTAVWLGNAKNWQRIGYVAGGSVLVLMGLSIVARPVLNSPGGQLATKAVKTVKAKATSKTKKK